MKVVKGQLRVTPWPGLPIPVPRLNGALYELDPHGMALRWTGQWAFVGEDERQADQRRRREEEISRLGEIYLELRRVDLGDPEAILKFANRFGVLAPGSLVRPFLPPELSRASDSGSGSFAGESLDSFRFAARCLADLTDAFIFLGRPGADAPIWREAGSMPGLHARKELSRDTHTDPAVRAALKSLQVDPRWEAEQVLQAGLTAGLAPFHPRVENLLGRPVWELASTIPTYAVCCLEIYNHICDGAHLRVCAKEDCSVEFVRQRGRAKKNRYRLEGVMYCSRQCATAVAVRHHRMKKRQQRKAASPPARRAGKDPA